MISKFMLDENFGGKVPKWMRTRGFDVFSIYEDGRGWKDEIILGKALNENRVVFSLDKDFGELVFQSGAKHCGVVLFRLADESPKNKIRMIEKLLAAAKPEELLGRFVVVTEKRIRFIPPLTS